MRIQTLPLLLLAALFSFEAYAISIDKHVSGRVVKKITSLSTQQDNSNKLKPADDKDGYMIEIEREIDGYAGVIPETDVMQSKVNVGLGINLTAGLAFSNSKKIKSLAEVKEFSENNPIDYFNADKALKMELEEKVHFNFFAGMVFDPHVAQVGVWAVATGGWDVTITRDKNDLVNVEFSLIDSKVASFYYDNFEVMVSYDIGKELTKGFTLTLNLKDPKAKTAYNRLFKGNILYAQQESLKNKNIVFLTRSSSTKMFKGTGLWARSPIISWFLFVTTQYLANTESSEEDVFTSVQKDFIASSYEDDVSLDFIGIYYGVSRAFEAKYDIQEKEYEIADSYYVEGNNGNNVPQALKSMLTQTRMDDIFNVSVPDNIKNSFFDIKLDVKYSHDFLKHLMSGNMNLKALKEKSLNEIQKTYEKAILNYKPARNSHEHLGLNDLNRKRVYDQQLVHIATKRIETHSNFMRKAHVANNIKGVLENYAILMKYVYKSPELYKQFVNYSKNCGTEITFELSTQAFAKKEMQQSHKKNSSCTGVE